MKGIKIGNKSGGLLLIETVWDSKIIDALRKIMANNSLIAD